MHGVEARARFLKKVFFRLAEMWTALEREHGFQKIFSWPKIGPREPKTAQERPKRGRESPKRAQDGPRRAQDVPKRASRALRIAQKQNRIAQKSSSRLDAVHIYV